MKQVIVLFLLSFLLGQTQGLQAQDDMSDSRREEKIKAYRIAMFTESLRLTSEEAQGFWPLYNEFLDKKEELQRQLRPSKQLDQMSDQEVEEQIKRHFEMRQREIDLEKDLYQKLRKVLPSRKIAKIPSAEREFREALVKKLQEIRQKRNGRGGRGN